MQLTLLKNGLLFDPSQPHHSGATDLLIGDSLVREIAPANTLNPGPDTQIIDLHGKLCIFPGLIDMHVHLRVPGAEYKEDLNTGLTAAAFGGFTAVLAMPNTDPPVDRAEVLETLLNRAKSIPGARLYQSATMTQGRKGEILTEYSELKAAGAVAVTDDGSWIPDGAVMRRVLDYAEFWNLVPLSHPEDLTLSKGGAINESHISTRLGLKGIPPQAEEIAIYRDIALAKLTGNPLHFCHISTAEGLALIRRAKAQGIPVTCETAPHYLFLTEKDVLGYETNAKMNPPLRSQEDQNALRQGILDGTIDCIASDHAPHSVLEKELEFAEASFGIIGLETSLPLILRLMRELGLSLNRLAELMSLNPAKILGLPVGLKPGNPADLTIVDQDLSWTYDSLKGISKSHNSPFSGWNFTGRAVLTLVDGKKMAGTLI